MKLSKQFELAMATYAEDPSNPRSIYALGAAFWTTVLDQVGELARDRGDLDAYLRESRDFLDFGLVEDLREDFEAARDALRNGVCEYENVKVGLFTDWMKDTISKISSGDRVEFLRQDIKRSMAELRKTTGEVQSLQDMRGELARKELGELGDPSLIRRIPHLVEYDELVYGNLKTKKAIARGVFFSVDDRRQFVEREKRLRKEIERNEALASNIQSTKARAEFHRLQTGISEQLSHLIDLEEGMKRLEDQIAEIEHKQTTMSPLEMENSARREIEYLRDLVKLSAKRLRAESCPVLLPTDTHFTLKDLCRCLDRVFEFDPRLFCNDRVPIFGKPTVLLVPGNGNALYDWKNNRFVVPMVPPMKNLMASVATGMIEYRLDADDDKKLLTSYNKLSDMKNIRSLFQLRTNLTKEYILWMTSEYQGYKVLPKEKRVWFEHEIAPKKLEIYCPMEYQQFSMSTEEYRDLKKAVESRMGENLEECAAEDLWTAGILAYQSGEFAQSFNFLEALLKKEPDHLFAYYNLGHVALKLSRKQDAIRGFNEFASRRSQSWWSTVARDNVRRLQVG